MKRILSMLLILCLMCAGFSAVAEEADTAAYSEKIIDIPENYSHLTSMCIAPDGSIVAAALNNQGTWDLLSWKDGANIPEVRTIALEGEIDSIDIAPDGQIMAVVTDYSALSRMIQDAQSPSGEQSSSNEQSKETTVTVSESSNGMGSRQNNTFSFGGDISSTIYWLNEDGTPSTSFAIPQMLMEYKALSGRKAVVSGMQSALEIYDETGSVLLEINQSNAQTFTTTDTTLFVMARNSIYMYDILSGEETRSVPMQGSSLSQCYATSDGTLYYLAQEGVYRILPGADQAELAMNAVGTLMGDPATSTLSFGVQPDGSIAALISEGGMGAMLNGYGMQRTIGRTATSMIGTSDTESKSKLVVYSPIDPALIGNREEFRITALRGSNRLRKAVSDFQRMHPELKVTLQTQLDDNDNAPLEDHIRTLNTDLLAGKGGDVLILDNLPMAQYASRGMLADLSALLPELNLLPGIASGEADASGKVYSVPAQFTFQTLWGRRSDIEAVQSLMDLPYPSDPDQMPMGSRTPEELLRLFLPSSEAYLKDDQGILHFNTPEFEEFLEVLYELYIAQGELPDLGFGGNTRRGGMNIQEMLGFYNGTVAFFPLEVNGLMQISTSYSLAGGDQSSFITLPSIDGIGKAYTPSVRVGINAMSSKQDLAKDFVRTMFSDEVQEMSQMNGLPTTVSAINQLFQDSIDRTEGGARGMVMIPGGVSLEIWEPDEAAWNTLKAMCMEVDTPAIIDETLLEFILSETENFFDGRASAAEAGEAVEQRAWYYLNE